MQVAKLFASLGFKIDTADLSNFESILNKTQGEMSQFAKDLNFVNQKLKTMKTRFGQANDALKDTDIANAADRVAKAVDKYVKNAKEIVDIDGKVEKVFLDTGARLDTLSNKLDGGTSAWNRYEQQVKEATARMKEFTAAARERQSVNPPRGTGAGSGANQGGNAGRRGNAGGRGNNGVDDEDGMSGVLLGGQKFGKAFVGQMAMGGALGFGYLIKEAVQTGREIDSMIFKLQAVSRSTQEFQSNLKYVRETAQYLAVDVEEFGNAYALIFQGTKGKYSQDQIQQMFTGFNEYFKTLKMSADDQKGALRGISQMFGKEKVQAQELIIQVGQRTAGLIQVFAKANDMTVPQLLKIMELGKTTTDMVVKAGLESAKAAKEMGTLPDALKTSVSAQARFTNELKWLAHTILKIVDPALAKMFDGLATILKILKPFVVGLFSVIGGLFQLFELLLSFDWWVYAGIVAAALSFIIYKLYSIGGAAMVAEGGTLSLAAAMKLLNAAFPILGLIALIGLLGVYKRQQDNLTNGVQEYTWIDLWVERLTFFFLLMRLGWLNANIGIEKFDAKMRDFFTITPPKWLSDWLNRKGDNPANAAETISQARENQEKLGAMLTPSNFGRLNQNLSIPVDVHLTIQNPDGSTYQARASETRIITVGALGIVT